MFEQLAEKITVGSILLIGAEVLALVTLANAIISTRTAAGAWGWGMALIAFPWLAVPLYWVFGRKEFKGYRERRREGFRKEGNLLRTLRATLAPHDASLDEEQKYYGGVLDDLSDRRYSQGNQISLLIDGDETFAAMFEIIESAGDYLLIQFFIIRSDSLGEKFRAALIKKAREGVRVYLLYDEIGSYSLPKTYIQSLREAGVEVKSFHSTQGKSNRFQINFRNHRKMVLADGLVATCGGHNVGTEYLGLSKLGHWRDTSVRISGPAAMSLQTVFLEDWYWATRTIPDLNWTKPESNRCESGECENMTALVLPFGPVTEIEVGTMFFLNAINQARKRIWIATPYFVPDHCMVAALQLAALRGVEVRIMIPGIPDKITPYLAAFSFLKEMTAAKVEIWRYGKGFLHQKVLLVDDNLASVGTANLDNRSFRLNFEVNLVVLNHQFCREVEEMLKQDFQECRQSSVSDYRNRPWWFRFGVRLARLASPIL